MHLSSPLPIAIGLLLCASGACSSGGEQLPSEPTADLAMPGPGMSDLSGGTADQDAAPSPDAGADAAPPEGLTALPDGIYRVLSTTSRLEHVGTGNPDRCPLWSSILVLTKNGPALSLTGDSLYGDVREINASVDPLTGKISGMFSGLATVVAQGTVRYTGGKLVVDATYQLIAPTFSTYQWQGELDSLVFGTSTVPTGSRRERLTWTDTNGRPDLNTVDLLKDKSGHRFVSLPLLVGSTPLAFDTGMTSFSPSWAVCAGPSASLQQQMATIYVAAEMALTNTTLPSWFQ